MPALDLFLNEPFCFGLELYRHAFKIREFPAGCKPYDACRSRRWSFKMQRSMTTSSPASSARRAASSWITPSCIQTTFAPLRMAA